MEEETAVLLGQLSAMSLTITAIISSLPSAQAAKGLQQLRVALDVLHEEDTLTNRNPLLVNQREAMVKGYLQNLRSAAMRHQQPPP